LRTSNDPPIDRKHQVFHEIHALGVLKRRKIIRVVHQPSCITCYPEGGDTFCDGRDHKDSAALLGF
jgi:hypothetical protein